MSSESNIDHSDINKIEKGLKNITLITLFDLADGLSIDPKRLLDFEFDFGDEN
ncbi:MAG: hypothetical protein J0H55_16005 [Chitinophagaceae bacterium]|nr:hypothetical protein [Chitinophagaceae bacterium]